MPREARLIILVVITVIILKRKLCRAVCGQLVQGFVDPCAFTAFHGESLLIVLAILYNITPVKCKMEQKACDIIQTPEMEGFGK
jgi:hypothetical protein